MPELDVDGLTFEVPASFLASRYDEWAFYRKQIGQIIGAKAVDLLIAARDGTVAYLVEAKDYRTDPVSGQRRTRTKQISLPDEVAEKALHSLGGLCAARLLARDAAEQEAARAACMAGKLRVVVHLEQPPGSRMYNPAKAQADIQTKVRQRLKGIDPHALVVSRSAPRGVPWHVR